MTTLIGLKEVENIISQIKTKLNYKTIKGNPLIDIKEEDFQDGSFTNIEKSVLDNYTKISQIDFKNKTLEDDKQYIVDAVVNVIEVLNDFYYNEEMKDLVTDEIYDRLKDDFLEILDPKNKIFDVVGEKNIGGGEKYFQESVHGFYNKNDEIVAAFEAGSMSKKKKDDFLTQEQQQKELDGEEVEPDFSAMKDFNNESLVTSDKLDGITMLGYYTKDKEKAINHIENIYKHQKNYIETSSKSEKEKQKILQFLKKMRNKIITQINNSKENSHILYKVVTRGDGDIGEDITFNAFNAQGVVFEIGKDSLGEYEGIENYDFVIRGEAVITKEDFKSVPYKNPRNGVAMIRNQEGDMGELITWVPFEKIAYDFDNEALIHSTRSEMFGFFKDNGFNYPQYTLASNMKEIYQTIMERFEERENNNNYVQLPNGKSVWTDGMIVSIDDKDKRIELGSVGKKPKGEFAFKPRPEVGLGEVESIDFTVGKTGVITPVIHLKEKILISGTEIQKLTGANEDILKELAPFKGALLEVVKRGEIIPKAEKNHTLEPLHNELEDFCVQELKKYLTEDENVLVLDHFHNGNIGVFFNKRLNQKINKTLQYVLEEMLGKKRVKEISSNENFQKDIENIVDGMSRYEELYNKANEFMLVYPSTCPSCSSELVKGKVLIKCINKSCEGIMLARLENFAQSLTKGIGEGKIAQLFELGKLKTYSDFFKIEMSDFKDENGDWIPGWQEVSSNKFLQSVGKIKKSKDNVFFGSIFFDGIGDGKFLKLFQDTSLVELLPLLNGTTEMIPEDLFTEKDSLKKVTKKLEDINYVDIDVFKKITSISGFAHKSAARIINTWIMEKEPLANLLEIIELEPTKLIDKSVKKGTIVLTGTLNSLPEKIKKSGSGSLRTILKDYLKERGYTVTSSVSSKTECVIAGEDPTQRKVEQAKEKGIPVYDEIEFFENFDLGEDVEKKFDNSRQP